jgi:hypothetical protein
MVSTLKWVTDIYKVIVLKAVLSAVLNIETET